MTHSSTHESRTGVFPRSRHGHYPSANSHSWLISYEKVTSHINESWHIWMSHVTHGSGIFSRSRHGRYQECERVLLTELDGSKVCLSLSLHRCVSLCHCTGVSLSVTAQVCLSLSLHRCVSLCHCTHEQCMAHLCHWRMWMSNKVMAHLNASCCIWMSCVMYERVTNECCWLSSMAAKMCVSLCLHICMSQYFGVWMSHAIWLIR